ncbi:uncharacterized protein FSUBG_5991 [Fusarium subglutinans]|uniref:Heterokaryon incompatibility domain-containing protein n=1 Tax=Gibberella subglutinans TaxID=42677 RepID=A0A8H5Q221_GIBSU|nr:uncharacterized protein FSUBG_5991 [Fusarium subglutinans]KAF5606592.1 hypothetical protein FSUBG_5991 [Fusarium subglutinans]
MATNSVTKAGSAPGLDVFKTPENPTFYSANLYQSLDKSKQEIRLIELSTQAGDDDMLECKLLPATLLTDARKQYLALSYCAGDPADTKKILVNGVRCNIFANLHHALVLARRYWTRSSGRGPLRIWIDQLCINQHDLRERSHQVGFMRKIYESAERTLACLSTSETSGEGLKWLNDLCDAFPFQEDDGTILYNREYRLGTEKGAELQEAIWDTSEFEWPRDYKLEKWFHICGYLQKHMFIEKFVNGWIAFYDVLTSPWWNRVWICQEFLVSSQLTFLFGNHFIPWEKCWRTMEAFCGTHKNYQIDRDAFLVYLGVSVGSPEDRQLCRILGMVSQRDHVRQVNHVGVALRMKIRWTGSKDIIDLLSHSRSCKSSDDRDRVYAILGLASPGYRVFPDYSQDMTAAQVMLMTTKAIIDKEDSLYVLVSATMLVRSRNLDVPSWVVDWSSTEASDIRNNFGGRRFHRLNWVPQECPEHSFETITNTFQHTEAHILRVYGTFVTKVQRIPAVWPQAEFAGAQGFHGSALVNISDGDELWILRGLGVPIILRPYRDGYLAISCAFLVGPNGEGFGTPVISTEEIRANRSRIILY